MRKRLRLVPQSPPKEAVTAVALTADGRLVATAHQWGDLFLWETSTGRIIRHTDCTEGDILTLSNDGRVVARGDFDCIEVWDTATGLSLRRIDLWNNVRTFGSFRNARLAADGQSILLVYERGVALTEIATAKIIRALPPLRVDGWYDDAVQSEDGSVIVAAVSSHYHFLIICHKDHTPQTITLPDRIGAIAISSDGKVVAASIAATITWFNSQTGEKFGTSEVVGADTITAISLCNSGLRAVCGSKNGKLAVLGAQRLERLIAAHGAVNSLAYAYKATMVATGAGGGAVWDTFGRLHRRLVTTSRAPSVGPAARSADGRTLVVAVDKEAWVWDLKTCRLICRLPHAYEETAEGEFVEWPSSNITAVAISADGSIAATAGEDNTLIVWDVNFAAEPLSRIKTSRDQPAVIRQICLSADGLSVASLISYRGHIQVWSAATGQLVQEIDTKDSLFELAMSADGSAVAARKHSHNTAMSWNVASGTPVGAPAIAEKMLLEAKSGPAYQWGMGLEILSVYGSRVGEITLLPEGHWVAVDRDELSYTGSEGVEEYLLVVDADKLSGFALDPAFSEKYRRDAIDLTRPAPGPNAAIRVEFPDGFGWVAHGLGVVVEEARADSYAKGSVEAMLLELIDPVLMFAPDDLPLELPETQGVVWRFCGWEGHTAVYRAT